MRPQKLSLCRNKVGSNLTWLGWVYRLMGELVVRFEPRTNAWWTTHGIRNDDALRVELNPAFATWTARAPAGFRSARSIGP